jgi:hypothetical protein
MTAQAVPHLKIAQWRKSLNLSGKDFRKEYKSVHISKEDAASLGAAGGHHHWVELVNQQTGQKNFFSVHDKNAHGFKRIGRGFARAMERPGVYLNTAVSTAVTYFGGPVLGEAVAGGLSEMEYSIASTAARAKGLHGRAARAEGRRFRERSFLSSQYGIGIGGLASAAAAGTLTTSQALQAGGQAAKIGLGALQKRELMRRDGSVHLSGMSVGSDMSGAADAGNILGQSLGDGSADSSGQSNAGMALVLIGALVLLSRKAA